jgi:hypothetical protein
VKVEQKKESVKIEELLVLIGDKELQLYYLRKRIAELEGKTVPQAETPLEG